MAEFAGRYAANLISDYGADAPQADKRRWIAS
jgi:hypothetical protein